MIHKTRGNWGLVIVREAKSIDCKRETAVVEYSRSSLELLVDTKVILKYYDTELYEKSFHSLYKSSGVRIKSYQIKSYQCMNES